MRCWPWLCVLGVACGDNKPAGAIDAPQDGDAPPKFVQTAYVKSATPAHDSHFGELALSGTGATLVVGELGAVTVFERDPSWRVAGNLGPIPASHQVGPLVAISRDGSTIAVAATTASYLGAVVVFRRTGATWMQEAQFVASDMYEEFPTALVLTGDGSTLVASSRNTATDAGLVATYERGDSGWAKVGDLGGTANDFHLGLRLAVSAEGDVLAASVSRPQMPSAVELYARTATGWELRATVASTNDSTTTFGTNLSCSAHCATLAIGAPQEYMMSVGTGVVYLFAGDGISWQPTATVSADNRELGDDFGNAVALSQDGATLVVGAPKEASAATGIGGDETSNAAPYAGAAYVFRKLGTSWLEAMYLKASNTGTTDIFGSETAVSDDATTIAIGAPYEASSASGIDGDQTDNSLPYAGAAYVIEGTY
ncbi:MAG TPA: hypothetical protein VIV58_30495 [Kofleriaceae bacterium]